MRFIQAPPGWTVEDHADYVSMVPPTRDAELRITIVDLEKPRFTPANWLKGVVYTNRKLERQIVATELGPFTGYAMETEPLDRRIRSWFLYAGQVPLVITYISPVSVGTRDDETVAAALQTISLADVEAIRGPRT